MTTIILISNIAFWILFYVFQGMHDVHVVKEVKLFRKNLPEDKLNSLEKKVVQQELKWKFWGGLEKSLTKIVLASIIYFLTSDIYFSLLCLVMSVSLRWLVHDLTVALGLGKGLKHIGPDFIWTDKILKQAQTKGINQYLIKITLNLLIIFLAIAHIFY